MTAIDAPAGPGLTWTGAQVLEATGGRLLSGSRHAVFTAVGIDSRRVRPGELFFAIRGPVHDGHQFTAQALVAGAGGVVIESGRETDLPTEDWLRTGVPCLTVADTTRALGDLGAFTRRRRDLKVVAITGSNGKTSTREMTAAVVGRRFSTLATAGNYNNEIGLPLTLFRLQPSHRRAVLELGMNHPGEIRRLAEICRPDVAVVTNVGPAHLEGFDDIEGVARAKAELVEAVGPAGGVVLNADDPRVVRMADLTRAPALFFGLSDAAQVRASDVTVVGEGLRFRLQLPSGRAQVRLQTPARFMVYNALAAAAVGYHQGVQAPEIAAALSTFQPTAGRMFLRVLGRAVRLIDDTYNANPVSMAAAIDTLCDRGSDRRRVVVAGDMFELGPRSAELHADIGKLAAGRDIARLCLAGEYAALVGDAARAAGMDPGRIFVGTREEIVSDLSAWLEPGDWVLVKGSRGMAMEKVVRGLAAVLDPDTAAGKESPLAENGKEYRP